MSTTQSEIRDSTKLELLEKVRKHEYGKYLIKASIQKIRGLSGEDISFDFPVTAIIGPNGSGKSSVLGAAACAYKHIKPSQFFPKSVVGDESMSGWRVEYDAIDKILNPKQLVKRTSNFRQAKWVRGDVLDRNVLFFGIERTVPAGEKTKYRQLKSSSYNYTGVKKKIDAVTATQIEHILGKSVAEFEQADIGANEVFFIGLNGVNKYSEFHFGAGESSIIRMISLIENAEDNSLVLIEEIENGLHPIATKRMVEYLIDVAERKKIQSIFTTHSDYALSPLPNAAVWACINNKLRQGKLNVAALRAVSGRVDKKLAIFVEDEFAKCWVDTILREQLGIDCEQLEVHAVAGDGNAVSIHRGHNNNPAIKFKSLCIIDGDSSQTENSLEGVLRLPGKQPELEVARNVSQNLERDLALITVSCQRSPETQSTVSQAIMEILSTNRDPHLIFNQIGIKIGFVSEVIIRGAFLSLWMRNNTAYCIDLGKQIRLLLED
jgi:AAA15 family ATPase/GTPase